MAWALQFDGVNDRVELLSPINFTTTQEYAIEINFKIEALTTNDIHTIYRGDGTNYLYYRVSTNSFLWKVDGSNISLAVPSSSVLGIDSILIIRQTSDGAKTIEFVGLPESSPFTALRTFLLGGFGEGGNSWNAEGYIQVVNLYSDVTLSTKINNWDATASSHAAGTPILTDTVGGNDATGVNMPTDGSAWVDLGGGGVTATLSEQGPSFTESITVSLSPLPITASLVEGGPSFTESISATVTSTLSINATLAEQGPAFTDSIVASLDANLSAAINELGPSFTDSITVNLTTSISASISESGPSFIESIIASIPVVITVNPKNIVRVKRKSNTVTIKRKSNIVRVR